MNLEREYFSEIETGRDRAGGWEMILYACICVSCNVPHSYFGPPTKLTRQRRHCRHSPSLSNAPTATNTTETYRHFRWPSSWRCTVNVCFMLALCVVFDIVLHATRHSGQRRISRVSLQMRDINTGCTKSALQQRFHTHHLSVCFLFWKGGPTPSQTILSPIEQLWPINGCFLPSRHTRTLWSILIHFNSVIPVLEQRARVGINIRSVTAAP